VLNDCVLHVSPIPEADLRSVPLPVALVQCALYHVADVMLISSVRDGMNLVAYEYIACQKDRAGVLIISEFAGAAQSLGAGAIQVNPWDVHDLAIAINGALGLSPLERREYHEYAFNHVMTHTAEHWARSFLQTLQSLTDTEAARRARDRQTRAPDALNFDAVSKAYARAKYVRRCASALHRCRALTLLLRAAPAGTV
jgi:trehalose 6-phosphate synthase/phosphatase